MKYTYLGRSGLLVSSLTFGCMSLGSQWGFDAETSKGLVKKALDAGITFFDNADAYSRGGAETILGDALTELGVNREEIVIGTKICNPMSALPNGRGLGRKHIMAGVDAQLKRLKTDYIDLYSIHRFDPNTPIEETLDALDNLVRSGKVRYLGASSMAAWQMMRMVAHSDVKGLSRFVAMQNHYNLIYREEEREMMPLCVAEGIGCTPWSPLARGRLSRPVSDGTTAREGSDSMISMYSGDAQEQAIIHALHTIAQARGEPMSAIALAWMLAKPGVASPIFGASKPHHFDDALRAVDIVLDADEMTALEAPYHAVDVQGTDLPFFLNVPWTLR